MIKMIDKCHIWIYIPYTGCERRTDTGAEDLNMAAKAIKQVAPVEIVGKGIVKATGAPVYGATSASEPNRLHLTIWSPTAHQWDCDCWWPGRRTSARAAKLQARCWS
jgi:hypothetical protein